jgi:hypothetical protein
MLIAANRNGAFWNAVRHAPVASLIISAWPWDFMNAFCES